jgi:DUF4097 and DUF4098 domain-containing protein YvlB
MKFSAIFISLFLVMQATVLARADGRKDKGRSQKVEQSVPADPNVRVSLCVASGDVNVRGWDKNEVLARSDDGVQIELRRNDATSQSQATKLEVLLRDRAEGESSRNSCQSSGDITLSVPRGATVQVQTRDGDISIIEVASAYAGSQNGDISIEQVSRSIEACSIGGSISIKNSTGRVNVTSVGGTLEAINLRPAESGDQFEAVSVSGDITLEQVGHAQLSARTVNGNVSLTGPLARRGSYGFKTMSGDVTLTLPADASFQLSAKVSQNGEIITDFPLKLITEDLEGAPPAGPEAPTDISPNALAPAKPGTSPTSPKTPEPAQPEPGAAPETPRPVKIAPLVKMVTVEPVVVMAPYALRRVNAIYGTGDATISVASFSGTLHLQKN